eukprot:scaffold1.g5706.t1
MHPDDAEAVGLRGRRRRRTSDAGAEAGRRPPPAKRPHRGGRGGGRHAHAQHHTHQQPHHHHHEATASEDDAAAEPPHDEQQDQEADPFQDALDLLMESGLPEDRAREALEATEQQRCEGAEVWGEEAQMWLLQGGGHGAVSPQGDGQQQQQQQQQQGGQQPAPADPFEEALELLKQAGAEEARAQAALDATEEEHRGQGVDSWADAAQLWMATDMDLQEEAAQMRELMQQSLEEAQERRRGEAPLEERPPEELQALFGDSATLGALLRAGFGAAALLGREAEQEEEQGGEAQRLLRPTLLEWLELERNCCKRCQHYFEQAAAQCVAQLPPGPPVEQQVPAGEGGAGAPPAGTASPLQQSGHQRQPPPEDGGGAPGGQPGLRLSAGQAAAAAAFLGGLLQQVKQAVFTWREEAPPPLFTEAIPERAEKEVVVLDGEEAGAEH